MKTFSKSDNFNQIVKNNNIVIFQYGTPTCMPCYSIKNRLAAWQEGFSKIEIYYISLEENMEIAAQNGILSAPTVEVYIEGKLYIQRSGYFSLDEILDKTEYYYNEFLKSNTD